MPYCHVVVTLPAAIAALAYHNKALVYDALFKASSEALLTIAADPKHLGACKPGFFLPVRVLAKLFRRLLLEKLEAAHAVGRLTFFGEHRHLGDADAFVAFLAPLRTTRWFVYSKRPFAGPQAVLAYLARYTHRVAIANSR